MGKALPFPISYPLRQSWPSHSDQIWVLNLCSSLRPCSHGCQGLYTRNRTFSFCIPSAGSPFISIRTQWLHLPQYDKNVASNADTEQWQVRSNETHQKKNSELQLPTCFYKNISLGPVIIHASLFLKGASLIEEFSHWKTAFFLHFSHIGSSKARMWVTPLELVINARCYIIIPKGPK